MSNIPRSDADTYANLKLATAAGENELNFGYLRMLFEYLIFFTLFFLCQRHLPAASALTLSNLLSPVWRLAHYTHYHVTKTKLK